MKSWAMFPFFKIMKITLGKGGRELSLHWLEIVFGRDEGSGHCVKDAVSKCSQYVNFPVDGLALFSESRLCKWSSLGQGFWGVDRLISALKQKSHKNLSKIFSRLSGFLPSSIVHQHQHKHSVPCEKHPEGFDCVLALYRLGSLSVACSFYKKWWLCVFWCALPKHLIQHHPTFTWVSCCEIPWYCLMTLFKQGFLSLGIMSWNDTVREKACVLLSVSACSGVPSWC